MSFIAKTTNTILYCRKWGESVHFYRDTLKLPITFETSWFIEFQLSETSHVSIADERRATIKSSNGQGVTLTLQVEDIDECWCFLAQKEVKLSTIKTHSWGARVFYFRDPEGYRLEIWSPT